jgi:entericidin B
VYGLCTAPAQPDFSHAAEMYDSARKLEPKGGYRRRLQTFTTGSKMIRRISASLLAALFVAGALGTLAACNTIEGAGKDIRQGGQAITDEAREQKAKH